ncbi:FxsA family protein [Haliea sp. E1-2-M8]|uniref:FxsA family protein n=1 Tax=Haliea sp. E1-2-M8 TaxID=3064706 RepID=UPI00271DBB9B|nr:FxsA family protein [Haliea sp. E1-2-M8]MDO8862499.1 FxsA family protein [Haliea sp. E1-2-M8]
MRYIIILLPWLELFTLIQLGVETSALTALGYVLVTLMLGLWLLRRQGQGMFQRLREAQEGAVLGPQLLLDDMVVGLAGLLLMVPGIISDVAALVVLIGPLRRKLQRWFGGPQPEPYRPERDPSDPTTLEGEYRRLDD